MRTGPRANLEALVQTLALAGHAPAAINLNQPGTYVHWDVFTVSVANLVLIAIMVTIFGGSWSGPGWCRCRAARRRTGCWCAMAWWPRAEAAPAVEDYRGRERPREPVYIR